MRKTASLLFLVLSLQLASAQIKVKDALLSIEKKDFQKIYNQYKAKGEFILYDLKNEQSFVFGQNNAEKNYLPASTFKILNSLIILETEVMKDEKEKIAWDGVDRGWEKWNQDHNLETGIKYSVVWLYQELARRVGKERMQKWVKKTAYGNTIIGDEIDTFWLKGKLRITPKQQVDFLKRLYHNELPFSQKNMDIVKRILINEKTNEYVLRGKTGWAVKKQDIGWYVGYLETKENVYFFANRIDIHQKEDLKARVEIVKDVFRKVQLMP